MGSALINSTNAGSTWSRIDNQDLNIYLITLNQQFGKNIVVYSNDGGATWSQGNNQDLNIYLTQLTQVFGKASVVNSTNGGASWSATSNSDLNTYLTSMSQIIGKMSSVNLIRELETKTKISFGKLTNLAKHKKPLKFVFVKESKSEIRLISTYPNADLVISFES